MPFNALFKNNYLLSLSMIYVDNFSIKLINNSVIHRSNCYN